YTLIIVLLYSFIILPQRRSTLFPYTTLFRSEKVDSSDSVVGGKLGERRHRHGHWDEFGGSYRRQRRKRGRSVVKQMNGGGPARHRSHGLLYHRHALTQVVYGDVLVETRTGRRDRLERVDVT